MFGIYSKRLRFLLPSCRIVGDSVTRLRWFHKNPLFQSSYSSKSLLGAEKGRSFTVSYLINSCGLSPKLALSVSGKVQFDSPEGPDSVLKLLKDHGLHDTQISILVKKRPKVLLAKAQKTLLPKLEFFGSIGLSGTALGEVLCSNTNNLFQSLERNLIPCYHIIKSVPILDEKVAVFFKCSRRVSRVEILSNIAPNISFLRALKVPEPSISHWVTYDPAAVSLEVEKFKENVNKAMSMGVLPSTATFMKALHVITLVDESKRAQKMEFYRKCGWTKDDFWLAFRTNPLFMHFSVKNSSSKLDFLVNKMGWQPADVARSPGVLTYSLEKWIIPRCLVIRVLLLKGLIVMGEVSMATFLMTNNKYFLDRFVIRYEEQVRKLLSIFQGKMGLAELGLGFEESGGVKQL